MKEAEKARRYESTHPGVDIPVEQKAERYDRKEIRHRNGGRLRTQRATAGSFTVTKVWPGHRDYGKD